MSDPFTIEALERATKVVRDLPDSGPRPLRVIVNSDAPDGVRLSPDGSFVVVRTLTDLDGLLRGIRTAAADLRERQA